MEVAIIALCSFMVKWFLSLRRSSPRMPLATCYLSLRLWWPGWRPGSLISRCSLRRPMMREVRETFLTSLSKTQWKKFFLKFFSSFDLSLPGSGERSLRTSPHDLSPCCFRRTVLLSAWIHRRWCLLGSLKSSPCVCVCVSQWVKSF